MLSLFALSAFAFTIHQPATGSPAVSSEEDGSAFTISILDDDVVEASLEGENGTWLGDFVVVKQWDAALGQFVIVRGWDAAGEIPLEDVDVGLGDFVVVKQWDIVCHDIVVVKDVDDATGDFVAFRSFDILDFPDEIFVVGAYPDSFYQWHTEFEQSPDKYAIELDGI